MTRALAVVFGLVVIVAAAAFFFLVVLPQGGPIAEPSPSAPAETVAASETPAPLDQDLLARRVTVLVLGRDWDAPRREANEEHNTDSIMVVSVNAAHDEVAMISIPRDTVDVPLGNGETWNGKLNAIARERGLDAMVSAVEALLQIEIDYHFQIDMDDFVRLVDGVGGVDVETPEPLFDDFLDFSIEAGRHHLDGEGALDYARTRQDGDHARSARQQEVLLEIARGIVDSEADQDFLQLIEGLTSLETDIPLDKIPTLLEIVRQSQEAEVTRRVLAPPEFALFEGDEGTGRGWVLIPNIDAMRAYAAEVMGGE